MAYVYKILNKNNGKFYVGHTTNIQKRFNRHKFDLNNKKHHSIYLQRAWDKYGEDKFEFINIKECSLEESIELEQYYLDSFKDQLYNTGKLATFGGDLISKHPKNKEIREMRRVIAIKYISSLTPEEKRAKYGSKGKKNPMFGKTHSEKVRKKLSELNKLRVGEKNSFFGKTHSLETRRIMSQSASERIGEQNHFYGKHHSEESKEKIRKANSGRKPVNVRKVLIDGVLYESVTEASRILNVVPATIIHRIKSPNKLYTNYEYVDI